MCIARVRFAIVVVSRKGEGVIVIGRCAQEKQFLHFFAVGVAMNAQSSRAAQWRERIVRRSSH
jgi:hypothetical protein